MNSRSAKALFTKSTVLLSAASMLICIVQAQGPEPILSKDRPLVEIDLHRFGYDTSSDTRRLQKFVDFTDASHLAVAWLTLDDPSNEKIGPLSKKPAHLHVLVLDATTGEKVGVREWSTPSTPVRFLGGRDGKFLTCTGNLLRSFSPSFEMVKEQDLHNDRACANQFPWNAHWGLSPSRRSLLISHHSGQFYQNTLLDTDTFSAVASWTDAVPIENISDHWLLGSCGQKREACVRGIRDAWRPFQSTGTGKKTNDFGLFTRFVSDNMVVQGGPWWAKGSVVTVEGALLFQMEPPTNRYFEAVATSDGTDKFAVIEDRKNGRIREVLDMGDRLNDRALVYSIREQRAIYAVKVKGDSFWTPSESHRNTLALSPDGPFLAVLDGANLKVYRLPDNIALH